MDIPITKVSGRTAAARIGDVDFGVHYREPSWQHPDLHFWKAEVTIRGDVFEHSRITTAGGLDLMSPLATLGTFCHLLYEGGQGKGSTHLREDVKAWAHEHSRAIGSLMMTLYQQRALVFSEDDSTVPFDWCGNWQSAQNYALHGGHRVIAIRGDGHLSLPEFQRMLDAERERYLDCFGFRTEKMRSL